MKELWAKSLFGAETRRGLVELSFEDDDGIPHLIGICSPTEARAFALSIIEAAEAAETDQLVMEWLKDAVGVQDDLDAVKVLKDFRERREQWRKREREE
jgi:hypothetical protein